jgi:PAS domain S-box-containing protein
LGSAHHRRSINLGFAFAILLLAWAGWYSYRGSVESRNSARWVAHTYEVLGSLYLLLSSLQEAETGQRGYIISGKQEYLGPYYHSATRIAGRLGQLRSLTADEPAQQQRLEVLSVIVARRIEVLSKGISIRQTHGLDAAIAVVLEGQGKRLMDSARTAISDMQAIERSLLRRRSAKSEALARRAELTVMLGSSLGLLLLATSALLANWEIRGRRAAEAGLRRANQELEDRVAARTKDLQALNQELRAGKDFLRKVVDTNPQLVFIKDWEGRFVLANLQVAELYGTTVEELEGKSDADFNPNHAEVESFVRADQEVMQSGRKLHVSEEAVTDSRTGATRWFQTVKVPLTAPDGRGKQVLGVSTEITERRNAEEQLRRTRDELAVTANRLHDEITTQFRKLQEAKAARDTLTHALVHDLRSPLTGLQGYLDLLTTAVESGSHRDVVEFAREAHTIAGHLNEMVSQVLDVSRLESGDMPLSPEDTDLVGLLPASVATIGPQPEGIDVVYETPEKQVVVACDREVVARVVANLVGNAFKFTRNEVRIGVEGSNGVVRVTVSDNGPGVEPEYREVIFEKFGQAPLGRVGKARSSGLGLTFCKLAVEAHGGKIGVDSSSGGGARFWIELPRKAEPR